MFSFRKPLLPGHYSVWVEPPDEAGDEILRIVSDRRSITLKGHSFREFHRLVVPLLDGTHAMEQICELTGDVFDADDLEEALTLLASHGIVVEGDDQVASMTDDDSQLTRLVPQLNYLHENMPGSREVQARIRSAHIAVVGLGGAGAATAMGLAAAGVGRLTLVDAERVKPADLYFSPFLNAAGQATRTDAMVALIDRTAPATTTSVYSDPVKSDEELSAAFADADYVVCCLDAGMLNLAYKLNRVCMAQRIPWIASSLEGVEVVAGPAFRPGRGPCFMCYRMRTVACSSKPESALAFEKYLDRKKTDLTDRHDNLVFGAGMVANMLGVQVVNFLAGLDGPILPGRLVCVNLRNLDSTRHTVLQKPLCPACSAREAE